MSHVKFNHPVQKSVNFIVDELLNEFPSFWGRDMRAENQVPAANIAETAEAYHMELLVPGRNKEEFKIDVEKGILTISYEKKTQQEEVAVNHLRKEFNIQGFKRSFTLNDKVNVDGVQAKYENGILKVYLPKQIVNEPVKQINIL